MPGAEIPRDFFPYFRTLIDPEWEWFLWRWQGNLRHSSAVFVVTINPRLDGEYALLRKSHAIDLAAQLGGNLSKASEGGWCYGSGRPTDWQRFHCSVLELTRVVEDHSSGGVGLCIHGGQFG